jgi:putative transposase
MTGNNPTDRSKLDANRHILTDKKGIPLSVVITPANTHDMKAVTNVIDNADIKRPSESSFRKDKVRKHYQHLCLDRAYNSNSIEKEIIKRGYVPHIPYKRKRGQMKEEAVNHRRYSLSKNKRWVVERKNKLLMA